MVYYNIIFIIYICLQGKKVEIVEKKVKKVEK